MRAASRCTAPMKAPSPPPTMPSRMRRPSAASLRPSIAMAILPSAQAERALDLLLVDRAGGEVVERLVGHADDVLLDKLGALARAVLGMLQGALPFQHRPGGISVLGELGENAAEIDMAVAERAEAPGAIDPGGIARIDALPAGRIELGVLGVEGLDALVIDVDEGEVVELLQHIVRGIVEDVAALVALQRIEEPLEGRAVENVLARMDLVGDDIRSEEHTSELQSH